MSVQNQPIHTYARIKPLFNNQQKMFFKKNVCTVASKNNDEFGFDSVFDDNSTNQEVYDKTTKKNIESSFQGFNSCVLAYGQTSSGKTHTMKGNLQNPGIIPLCLIDIFRKIQKQSLSSQIIISYMQIYNEDIIDLLADQENKIIEPRQDQKKNLNLAGLKELQIKTISEAMCSQKGQEKRKFASNNLNVNSSRSHAIFRINLNLCDDNGNFISSQINLVDLAGSQGIQRTRGQKISKIQGENINKSILALTRVIKTMSQRQKKQWTGFRDSKLTRVLQKSLCQNSKSSIICMVNPNVQNHQQCMNTFKFGQMAAKIKIEARQNMILTQQNMKRQQNNFQERAYLPSQKMQLQNARSQIQGYQRQIEQLRKQNIQLVQDNYYKGQTIRINQKWINELKQQIQCKKRYQQMQRGQTFRQKQMLQNRMANYKDQIQDLQTINNQLKKENRKVQKNEKDMAERLQLYENQSKHLLSQLNKVKQRFQQENSKSKKPSSLVESYRPQKIEVEKPNPFRLPPYRQSGERVSPTRLKTIVELKVQVIDLGRQVNQFIKANVEIADENQQLKNKIQEYERDLTKSRTSGKINPDALQYNQIRKLNNKIKDLKRQLKIIQQKQKKNRHIIKKQSQKHLAQIQQFQEWFQKKYNSQYLVQNYSQTELVGEGLNEAKLALSKIKQDKNEERIEGQGPSKSLIFSRSNNTIKNLNPQQNIRHSPEQIKFLLHEQRPDPNENMNMNIVSNFVVNQNQRISSDSCEGEFLLDNLSQNNGDSLNKKFIFIDESLSQKRYLKNVQWQKNISTSKKLKFQDLRVPQNPKQTDGMICEQDKQIQI